MITMGHTYGEALAEHTDENGYRVIDDFRVVSIAPCTAQDGQPCTCPEAQDAGPR
jgi:hypothetical protein